MFPYQLAVHYPKVGLHFIWQNFKSFKENLEIIHTLSDISDDVSDDDRGIFSCKSAAVILSPFISTLAEKKV